MRRCDLDRLDATQVYWVAAVVAPERNWAGAPGCRKGARFLIDSGTFAPSRDSFEAFESRLGCLSWILGHRAELNRALPGARVRAVALDRWLLGLD